MNNKISILPCRHDASAVQQIPPTIDLLKHLDEKYPDILIQEGIKPVDYHKKKVFRSAVETIRGEYIASTGPTRQSFVEQVLFQLKNQGVIPGYDSTSGRRRYDFTVLFQENPRVAAALEVKGGEGNSINISQRPTWAQEFVVWCHLDGSIVNEPSHGAYAVVCNRVVPELVRRHKLVDAVLFRDVLCGTTLRPCPKYPPSVDLNTIAPDIFFLPQRVPTQADPQPPVHSLATLRLPKMILDYFKVSSRQYSEHVWEVQVEIFQRPTKRGKTKPAMKISLSHKGQKLLERIKNV